MHFLFYVVNFSDIILFNILKYHLNCKLFQKNFSLKESLKDTFLNSFKIYNGTYSFRKKRILPNLVRETLEKSELYHPISLITLSSDHFLYFCEASWLKLFDHAVIKSLFIFSRGFLTQIPGLLNHVDRIKKVWPLAEADASFEGVIR